MHDLTAELALQAGGRGPDSLGATIRQLIKSVIVTHDSEKIHVKVRGRLAELIGGTPFPRRRGNTW